MSRREAWLTALGIFLFALAVRAVAASAVGFPKPEDSAYYVGVARNLVEGRGLISDALWSYGTPPLVFPRPAFEIWLPLPSLLFAIPIALSGATAPIPLETALRASQAVTAILGALLCVLAWRLAADVAAERGLEPGRARTLAVGTGLTAAVYLPLLLHAVQPDSTILFGVLAVGACLLMTRVLRDPRGARLLDPRLLTMGLLVGAAALTRNEALWVAMVWAWLAIRRGGSPLPERLRLIGVVAVVSLLVFAPWAARDWIVYGNPLPGQAVSNALSVTGFDIFAWNDPPTLARYLAVGPARLLEMRVEGLAHNMFNVLVFLGIPLSVVGILALPWQARDRALRPVVLISALAFLVTEPPLPCRHHLGHVPPRRGARPRADHRVGIGRAGRGPRPPRPAHGLDQADRVAGCRVGGGRLRAVRGRARADHRDTGEGHGAHLRGAGARDGGDRRAARRRAPGDPRLPDLAGGDAAGAGARPPGRDAVGRARPRRGVRRPVAHRGQGRSRRVARDP